MRIFARMKEQEWSENVILVDADYVDKVVFDLTVNFERMIGRQIPKADMAQWLECVALDGGLRPQPSGTNHQVSIQVVLLHKQQQMENFVPGSFAELDGKAFTGPLEAKRPMRRRSSRLTPTFSSRRATIRSRWCRATALVSQAMR